MKNIKTITLGAIALLAIGGGVWFYAARDNPKPNNSQSAGGRSGNRQSSAEAAKSETEKLFETYFGEDYDRYFLANMIAHHQGAIDMARRAQAKAGHAGLKAMAGSIISAQTAEINSMLSWQRTWGYPASSGETMQDHSAMGMMDDMAKTVSELEPLSGDDFDRKFMELMIEHHESAVAMSRPAAKNAFHQEIKDVAKAIIEAQDAEIAQMRRWQVEWGYQN